MNIAVISPFQDVYSETFIKAHKESLKGKVFYYFGNPENLQLEGAEGLQESSKKIIYKLQRNLFKKPYSWYYQQFIIESFKKNEIDVVLAEYGTTAHTFLPVIKELEIPLITHFHGYDASNEEEIKSRNYYKEVFEYSSSIVVVSMKMYNDLIKLGCLENKTVYNPYGPKNEFFKVEPEFGYQQFISVGRFVDKKAPYFTLLAFKEVVKEFPNAKLVMAGEGHLLNTCQNLVKYFEIDKNVSFVGIISSEEFQDYLKNSLGFIQHSITAANGDAEGTPVSILEAGAAGVPVVSTKHAGIPDVVLNDITGFLVEEHDVEGMSLKMMQLLKDPALARSLGQNAKQRINQNFTLSRHINILDELLEKAVYNKP